MSGRWGPWALWSSFIVTALLALAAGGIAQAETGATVVLQGLDKVTARVTTLTFALGRPVSFGTLTVVARRCDRSPPEAPPETTAFLEIVETKPGDSPVVVFRGWMFSSNPALSAMEHPVYDLRVLGCLPHTAVD